MKNKKNRGMTKKELLLCIVTLGMYFWYRCGKELIERTCGK